MRKCEKEKKCFWFAHSAVFRLIFGGLKKRRSVKCFNQWDILNVPSVFSYWPIQTFCLFSNSIHEPYFYLDFMSLWSFWKICYVGKPGTCTSKDTLQFTNFFCVAITIFYKPCLFFESEAFVYLGSVLPPLAVSYFY